LNYSSLKVLLFGSGYPHEVGSFFWDALEELGCQREFLDTRHYYPRGRNKFERGAIKLLSKTFLPPLLNQGLVTRVKKFQPDFTLIIKGTGIYPTTLEKIKAIRKTSLVNYAPDDPFNAASCGEEIRDSIPYYDFYACTKKAIIQDVLNAGCKHAEFVPFAFSPKEHFPEAPGTRAEITRMRCDVVFIGGADAHRVEYFTALQKNSELKVHLYGNYWGQYPELRSSYRGYAYGRTFRMALGSAKIAPGFVRHSNRDGHSMRTFEIPACGGFLLAERTEEHEEMFEEDKVSVFFDSIDEFSDKIIYYSKNEKVRNDISNLGFDRIVNGDESYRKRLKSILDCIADYY
jgi:hypothetical protein